MACPHYQISIRQRSRNQSAVAGAAYQSGTRLYSEYDFKYKDYSNKSGEVVCAEILLPPNAPVEFQDRQTLWNAVEKVEKQWNAQLARGIIMALPRELPAEQYEELVRAYCLDQFVSKGMCCDFAIHDKGDGNPHAHIMLTMRPLDEQGRWLPKSHREYMLDENGERIRLPSGDWKSRRVNTVDWNDRGNAEVWRQAWANHVNQFFERNGIEERLDLRSYERQGIDQVPTVHMGPAASKLEEKGVATSVGNLNRDIKAHNQTVTRLKKMIADLRQWITKTKERISVLMAEEPEQQSQPVQPKPQQSPRMVDLISAYNDLKKQGRADWNQAAKNTANVKDLKFLAEATAWFQQYNIRTLDDFNTLLARREPLINQLAESQQKLKKVETGIGYIEVYNRLLPIYQKSLRGFEITKKKFAADHKAELAEFQKANRYLKANGLSADSMDRLRAERAKHSTESQTLTNKLNQWHMDPDMIKHIRYCINTVLDECETVPEKKASVMEKLKGYQAEEREQQGQQEETRSSPASPSRRQDAARS